MNRGNPFLRFSSDEVREMLRGAGLADNLAEENVAKLGVQAIRTQRERVLAAYEANPDAVAIFEVLGGTVPLSSIRSYLCREFPNGAWRQRRRRGSGREGGRGWQREGGWTP